MVGSLAIWGGATLGLVVGLVLWLKFGNSEYIFNAVFLGLMAGVVVELLAGTNRNSR